MKLINPKTKQIIDVPDSHGEMLLRQKFYQKVDTEVEAVVPNQNNRKRSRKDGTRSNKSK